MPCLKYSDRITRPSAGTRSARSRAARAIVEIDQQHDSLGIQLLQRPGVGSSPAQVGRVRLNGVASRETNMSSELPTSRYVIGRERGG
jgi:hypothetical protein